MADRVELPYGTFGHATHNRDDGEWTFSRWSNGIYSLESVENRPQVSDLSSPDEAHPSTEAPSDRFRRQINQLVRRFPEVQPATSLLPALLRSSEAVQDATKHKDQSRGSLLSMGRISDRALHAPVQVLAYATGTTGGDLCVVHVRPQRQGWDDCTQAWISVPNLRGDQAIWHGPGAPIQQVTFARSAEDINPASFLAIRMLDRTTLFQPVLEEVGPERLRLNLVGAVRISDTGGESHVDVAFNPWSARQFGIIDQVGSWSIWELAGRYDIQLELLHERRSDIGQYIEGKSSATLWARIFWVGGPTTIAICTRRGLTLFRVAETLTEVQQIQVLQDDDAGWILDAQTVPNLAKCLLVLTSMHLLLFHVREDGDRCTVQSLLQIRHFGNPEDLSTRMILMAVDEGYSTCVIIDDDFADSGLGVTVLLRRSTGARMLCYRITDLDEEKPRIYDPSHFQLLQDREQESCIDLSLMPVNFGQNRSANVQGTRLQALIDDHITFTSAIMLTTSFAVHSELLYSKQTLRPSAEVVPPTWKSAIRSTTAKLRKDEFVVESDEDEPNIRARPVSTFMRKRIENGREIHGRQWTMDYTVSARQLDELSTQETQDLDEIIAKSKTLIEKGDALGVLPMRCLHEVSNASFAVPDVDQLAESLNELLSFASDTQRTTEEPEDNTDPHNRLVIQQLELPAPLYPHRMQNISSAYDSIVSDWISPLSTDVSGRVRLAKELLARSAAAELALASHVLRVAEPVQSTEPSGQLQNVEPQHNQFKLPLRESNTTGELVVASASSSQLALPTPSPSATPSVITGSSQTSAFAATETIHLSRYTTFSKPLPISFPRPVRKVLRHWEVGSDPASYDWLGTARHITRQTEEEVVDSQLTERERARLKRKAERHIKRQRREAAASQQQQLASSQVPELFISASQPVIRHGDRAYTQPGMSTVTADRQAAPTIAASQVERGRYGARPAKKKRKQGF